jgi:hypothetical protein
MMVQMRVLMTESQMVHSKAVCWGKQMAATMVESRVAMTASLMADRMAEMLV